MKIIADVDKCTGCDRCKLACSYQLHEGFNVFLSNIEIEKEITGLPLKIYFKAPCIDLPCKKPLCIEFCLEKALEII
ncbi:MAG: hypothetical protein N2Z81_04415 [Hydrogenothermaceae bacterium]|nr:hypothetical protein [Hydrogenothermaceae bacterium]